MKKILISTCEGIQQKTCEGLADLLRKNAYEVEFTSTIKENRENYNLAVTFGRDGYAEVHSKYPNVPIYCAERDSTMSFLFMNEIKNTSNSSVPNILLGTRDYHSLLRALVLLNIYPDWSVDVLYSGSVDISAVLHSHIHVYEENEADRLIGSADLIIGCGTLATQGALCKKPVIVLGKYGSGGLLTKYNVYGQCHNDFHGRIDGSEGEYFSLADLKSEIEKGLESDLADLNYIAGCVKNEIKSQRELLLKRISALCS